MHSHKLVVKGGRIDALSAARAHGIRAVVYTDVLVHDASFGPGVPHTILTVQGADDATLARWMAEDAAESPYPIGSLLWYGAAQFEKSE